MMSNKNDWYERGELPPVGEICNYKTSSGKSAKVEITAHSRMGICFCEVGRDGESYVSKGQILNFAPIRTERDVLVEKAADAMRGTELNLTGSHLRVLSRQLIDAGWRPVKQQSEVEFINQCVDIREHGSTSLYRSLYLAGCRFIEQGE